MISVMLKVMSRGKLQQFFSSLLLAVYVFSNMALPGRFVMCVAKDSHVAIEAAHDGLGCLDFTTSSAHDSATLVLQSAGGPDCYDISLSTSGIDRTRDLKRISVRAPGGDFWVLAPPLPSIAPPLEIALRLSRYGEPPLILPQLTHIRSIVLLI
jgi:hypothetical protein